MREIESQLATGLFADDIMKQSTCGYFDVLLASGF